MDQKNKEIGDSSNPVVLGTSSNNNGSEIEENGLEANREKKHLEKEDNGSSRNVEDKISPEDALKEIQLRKTHDLYCPNCIHNITETAKFFEKGEETFPYNNEKFISWFVIVISFKYPFIYLPWLYNSTPDGLEPPQRVVDDMPRKHVLEWLWLLLVLILLSLSAILLSILLFLTSSLLLSPSSLPLYTNTNRSSTSLIHDLQKQPKYITQIHDCLRPHAFDIVENNRPNPPSSPSPPPPPSSNANESLTILVHDLQKLQEHVIENYSCLKSHIPNVVEDNQTIPPSLPPPLSPQPSLPYTKIIPHFLPFIPTSLPKTPSCTNENSIILIPNKQNNLEDIIEICGHPKPHVSDTIKDDKYIPPSLPSKLLSLPQTSLHTDESSTTLIFDRQKIPEDMSKICDDLKPYVLDAVKDDKTSPFSLFFMSPSPSLPQTPPRIDGSSTTLISDMQKNSEGVIEIFDHLKPHVFDTVKDDKIIPPLPSTPPPLPQTPPHSKGSSTTLIPDMQKNLEDVREISDHLKPHVPDVMKDDKTIPLSFSSIPPSQPHTPSHTDENSTILIPDTQKIREDVSEINGNLKPHVPDFVKNEIISPPVIHSKPSSLSHTPPRTDETSITLIPDMQKITEDVIKIQGHLKPHNAVKDDKTIHFSMPSIPLSLPQTLPHTDGSSTTLIPDIQKIPENVLEICGHLKPHVLVAVKDDIIIPPFLPSKPLSLPQILPQTDGSSATLIPDIQKIPEDVSEIYGHLKLHVPDAVKDDKTIPLSLPSTPPSLPQTPSHTTESSTILIPDMQEIPEDVIEICDHLKPYIPDAVKDDISISLSRPSTPTNVSSTTLISDMQKIPEDLTKICGHLKPHGPDHKISEDVTEICGHVKPHVLDDVKDDITILPSMSPLLTQTPPCTDGSSITQIPDVQKISEDVIEIYSHLKLDVLDAVKDDKTILHSLPSMPLSLPQTPPRTDGSSTTLILDIQEIPEDVSEIRGHLTPLVPDAIKDDKTISFSLPSTPLSLPQTLLRTDGSSTTLLLDILEIREDVIEIGTHLKPHVDLDALKDERIIPFSLPYTALSLSKTLLHTDGRSTTPIHMFRGHLKPHVHDVVPQTPSRILDIEKISEEVIENYDHLKAHVPNIVKDDKTILLFRPSMSLLPQTSPPTDDTSTTLIANIDGHLKSYASDVVEEIHGHLKPHTPDIPDVVEHNRSIPPSLLPIKNKGDWIPWLKYISRYITLSVILLFLLAILALCWLSIYCKKRTKSKNDVANVDVPNGEAQDSTNNPEDVTGVENNEDVASQNDDLSTTDHKTKGSGTETVSFPPVISPPMPSAKHTKILWQDIIVPVQNVLRTELDIIKSIVYGGLIESITSFGVVSSAAASGTSTVNVMALGLANLFSGLFLIIYNLCGLVMSEPFYQSANINHMTDVKVTDPYEELLGNRNKVILHCVVVVVSFTFFGVIPPLFYGLSFKITDNGYYEEAAVVVAASLVCVISLSFAKAYAFGMDKLKTVAAYTGIAIVGSVISFIASQHARDMFEKHDLHKLASDYLKG